MASDLLTVAQVKEHVETGLSDEALGRIVDAEDSYIRRMVGAHDPETTIVYETENPGQRVWLPRLALAITSVEERYANLFSDWLIREASYYRLADQGRSVEAIVRPFRWFVRVTFTPVSENPERTQALIDLVRLETQDTGLESEGDDTFTYKAKDKVKARREIIAPLKHGYRMLA